MNTSPDRLAIVGQSDGGRARTYRLNRSNHSPKREAAYRRLAAAILGLDVAHLAQELSSSRVERQALASHAA